MKKIVSIVITTLFVLTSFIALPTIRVSSNTSKLNHINVLNDVQFSNKHITRGNLPLPPVIWTEDFSTFCISVPQDPDNDQIYYFIDWDDGTSSGWIGPYEPGETVYIMHVWSEEGSYKIAAKAKDQDGESRCAVYRLNLSSDFKFFGVETGYVNIIYIFTIYLKQYEYFIFFDWGDGTTSDWLGPYNGTSLSSHSWSSPGKYLFRFKMKDIYGSESEWITLIITILTLDNNAPKAPIITGPRRVKPGTHEWKFKAIDPDGDNISYYIEWGDGYFEDWFGPFKSGEEVALNHTFYNYDKVTIRVKAKDIYNATGDWGHLEVVVPKSTHQSIITLFCQLIKRLLIIQ